MCPFRAAVGSPERFSKQTALIYMTVGLSEDAKEEEMSNEAEEEEEKEKEEKEEEDC